MEERIDERMTARQRQRNNDIAFPFKKKKIPNARTKETFGPSNPKIPGSHAGVSASPHSPCSTHNPDILVRMYSKSASQLISDPRPVEEDELDMELVYPLMPPRRIGIGRAGGGKLVYSQLIAEVRRVVRPRSGGRVGGIEGGLIVPRREGLDSGEGASERR